MVIHHFLFTNLNLNAQFYKAIYLFQWIVLSIKQKWTKLSEYVFITHTNVKYFESLATCISPLSNVHYLVFENASRPIRIGYSHRFLHWVIECEKPYACHMRVTLLLVFLSCISAVNCAIAQNKPKQDSWVLVKNHIDDVKFKSFIFSISK